MKIKKLLVGIQKIFLAIFMLYAFIPFETKYGTITYVIHAFPLLIILWIALHYRSYKIRMNRNLKSASIFLFFLILLASLNSYKLVYILAFILSIIFAILITSAIHNNHKFKMLFIDALKYLMIFSVIMLFIQIIIFTLNGEVLLFHKIIFPFSKARIGILENFNNLHRMGGIYIEPGTYANWMYLLVIIYIVLNKDTNNPLLFLIALSIILSYSVWGMLFGSYFLIILILLKIKKFTYGKKIFIYLLLILIIYFFLTYILETPAVQFALNKITVGDGSLSAKEEVYFKYKNHFEDFLIIGEGFLPKFNIGLTSVQDAGFLINLSIVFGIFFTIIIMMIYIYNFFKCCGASIFIVSIPIFISKIYYYEPTFWLLFFIILYERHSEYITIYENKV